MPFLAVNLSLSGVVVVTPHKMVDARGEFAETYRADSFREFGITTAFVQDNQALSRLAGTIRGLHFQQPPHAQAKLVRVLSGAIFDVAVDVREGSPTFGQWVSAKLDAKSGAQIFVPRGFAHGYCTMTDHTVVAYKCDAFYVQEAEAGIHFADPDLAISWPVAVGSAIVSDKDRALPKLTAVEGSTLPAIS